MELNDLALEEAVERFHAEAERDFDANYVYTGEAFYEKSTEHLVGHITERRHGWTFYVPNHHTDNPTFYTETAAIAALRSAIIDQLAQPCVKLIHLRLQQEAERNRALAPKPWWKFWRSNNGS